MGPAGHSLAALSALAMLPAGVAALALRPHWRAGLRERLGWRPVGEGGAVWVHGASVGEARVASRVLTGLRGDGVPVVASTMTVTGRDLLRTLQPDVPVHLAPLDHPWSVAGSLRRVKPRALVFVETELWPSWLSAARERGIPTAVVSGRISDRSLPRYRRLGPLLRPMLSRLALVGARSAADAERFVALGAREERVEVTGDLKLEPPEPLPAPPAALVPLRGAVPWVMAGSTHEGEEQILLDALAALEQQGVAAVLALAPRHPERFARVAELIVARGRVLRRRSSPGGAPLAAGEVLLLDSVGELAGAYGLATVAFVGGTLVPVGGHNLLEPGFTGRPVLFGPHTQNGREAAELLLGCGAGKRVADGVSLSDALATALRDPVAADAEGARAREALVAHRGAVGRTLAALRELLREDAA